LISADKRPTARLKGTNRDNFFPSVIAVRAILIFLFLRNLGTAVLILHETPVPAS